MIGVWVFLHLLGMVMWLGGALASMTAGISAKKEAMRVGAGATARLQAALHVRLIGPGAFLTVMSGLMLTIRIYGATRDGAPGWPLIVMQLFGVLAAILVLFVGVPTAARLARIDPEGPHARAFQALRSRQAVVGAIAGVMGLLALIGGALLRYPL